MVPQLVYGVKVKVQKPLQLRLADGRQLGALELFAQQHAEHRRLLGVFQGNAGKMHPGAVGPGGKQHLAGHVVAPKADHQFLPVGLVNLIHPRPYEFLFQFFFYVAQKRPVQCHI